MEVCGTAARDSAKAGWALENEEWQDENGSSTAGVPHIYAHEVATSTDADVVNKCKASLIKPYHVRYQLI